VDLVRSFGDDVLDAALLQHQRDEDTGLHVAADGDDGGIEVADTY
jgi:hypothetical protein